MHPPNNVNVSERMHKMAKYFAFIPIILILIFVSRIIFLFVMGSSRRKLNNMLSERDRERKRMMICIY